jgi:hypothetical protein
MVLFILASLVAKHPTVTEALQLLVNAVSGQVGARINLSGSLNYREWVYETKRQNLFRMRERANLDRLYFAVGDARRIRVAFICRRIEIAGRLRLDPSDGSSGL